MIAPLAEQTRVASHIHRAEALAAARDLSELEPLQQLVRQLLLEELARYRAAGRFPINPGLGVQTPIFVDDHGTRCAMAHLLEVGGEGALVEKIRTERNLATVKDLADEPRLLAWLAAAGISVEEAAAIQPSYCETGAGCICGGTWRPSVDGAKGVIEVSFSGSKSARVEAVYGNPGVSVGDEVPLSYSGQAGTRALMLDAEDWSDGGRMFVNANGRLENGSVHCASQGASEGLVPPISVADYAKVVTSGNCKATLLKMYPVYGGDACRPRGPLGCVAAGNDPTSLGILLSILGVLLARKVR